MSSRETCSGRSGTAYADAYAYSVCIHRCSTARKRAEDGKRRAVKKKYAAEKRKRRGERKKKHCVSWRHVNRANVGPRPPRCCSCSSSAVVLFMFQMSTAVAGLCVVSLCRETGTTRGIGKLR